MVSLDHSCTGELMWLQLASTQYLTASQGNPIWDTNLLQKE